MSPRPLCEILKCRNDADLCVGRRSTEDRPLWLCRAHLEQIRERLPAAAAPCDAGASGGVGVGRESAGGRALDGLPEPERLRGVLEAARACGVAAIRLGTLEARFHEGWGGGGVAPEGQGGFVEVGGGFGGGLDGEQDEEGLLFASADMDPLV